MKTLHLVLKSKWYDMIESGVKKEEYREIKPYWCNRLVDNIGMGYWKSIFDHNSQDKINRTIPKHYGFTHYDCVTFSYGYTSRTMTFDIESISIDFGKEEWGAWPGTEYFVIKLGKRHETEKETD